MIRRLRWRFIFSAMSALLLVMMALLGTINGLAYWQNIDKIDGLIDLIATHEGRLPQNIHAADGKLRKELKLSAETPYETRYFTVRLNGEDRPYAVNLSNIAGTGSDRAKILARMALNSDKPRGSLDHFRYRVIQEGKGKLLIFLDTQNEANLRREFIRNSLSVSIVAFFATFILVVLFSKRAVQPIIDNHNLQRRFISDAGHELKTPLSIISANVDILELTGGQSEWTESIHRQVDRMNSLIGELLKLSTMEDRAMRPRDYEFQDFSQITEEIAESFQPVAQHDKKALAIAIEPNVRILADGQSLANLVSVLVDNALKYSPQDSTVEIALHSHNRQGARLSVSNTCLNPPNVAELNRLFERFYRADPSRARQSGGFGIGLSMAKAIVQAHKGQVTADLQDDRITFTVLLP